MIMMKKNLLLLLLFCLPVIKGFSQEMTEQSDTLRKDALNVYMQATDYIKKEMSFINFVRDIKVADVYIISTSESTGSGGVKYTYFITGQKAFSGMIDTITYVTAPDDTQDNIRAKGVKALKMGLVRYVAKTPLAEYLDIGFTQKISETVSTDKWNSWVYRASLSAYSSGQKTSNYSYLYGTLSANRITEKSKFQSSISIDLEKNTNKYIDTVYSSSSRDEYLYLSYVKSINEHWSAGGSINMQTSSYSNFDLSANVMPGIEYNIFPYSESTRRQLRLLYNVGVVFNNYSEITQRSELEETIARQSLSASLSVIQKWGSVSSSLTWSNYFFDWSYNNLRLNTSANLRIMKGLSFSISGSFAFVNDQISLPLGNASLEDVLRGRKMQATNYTYNTSFGLSYTLGSIYNNVVNPRFGN
jgi:hypothetical protein